jgi:hypothetical protein
MLRKMLRNQKRFSKPRLLFAKRTNWTKLAALNKTFLFLGKLKNKSWKKNEISFFSSTGGDLLDHTHFTILLFYFFTFYILQWQKSLSGLRAPHPSVLSSVPSVQFQQSAFMEQVHLVFLGHPLKNQLVLSKLGILYSFKYMIRVFFGIQ